MEVLFKRKVSNYSLRSLPASSRLVSKLVNLLVGEFIHEHELVTEPASEFDQ